MPKPLLGTLATAAILPFLALPAHANPISDFVDGMLTDWIKGEILAQVTEDYQVCSAYFSTFYKLHEMQGNVEAAAAYRSLAATAIEISLIFAVEQGQDEDHVGGAILSMTEQDFGLLVSREMEVADYVAMHEADCVARTNDVEFGVRSAYDTALAHWEEKAAEPL